MPEEDNSSSFADRYFGPILTFLGVVGAAALAGNSAIFRDNNPPLPEIVIGETSILTAAAANQPRSVTIPAGYPLSFFAGKSGDPDSKLQGTTFSWVISGSKSSADNTCAARDAICRKYTLPALEPGLYNVSLVMTDGQSCGFIRRNIDDLGCEKSAADSVMVRVVPDVAPRVILQPSPTTLGQVDPLELDARMSVSYDGTLPTLEWLIDDVVFARDVSIVTIDPRKLALAESATGFSVKVVARDRLGRISDPVIRQINISHPKVVASAKPPANVSPDAGNSISTDDGGVPSICSGGASYLVRASVPVTFNGECILPKELITNGLPLYMDVGMLRSEGSVIRAFPPGTAVAPEGTARSGNPGAHGSFPGADGAPGGAGDNGRAGTSGVDAASITIKSKRFVGDLTIINTGQTGSEGSRGGEGGTGGNGAQGQPAASGILDCRRGPGRGGNGGVGGSGGSGGKAGTGGAGGTVLLDFDVAASGSSIDVSSVGGRPGQPGAGGRGGRGGEPGPEGPTSGLCGPAGRSGYPGANGPDGSFGETSPIGIDAPISVLIGGKEQQRGTGSASLKVL